ncbi:MAG: hypothetical protein ABMA14_17640 [Hyphomonadaceae bacterium]
MPGRWSLDCEVKDLREAFHEQGFAVPSCYVHGVSEALGGHHDVEQIFAEADAEIARMISVVSTPTRMIEVMHGRPIDDLFRALENSTREKVTELAISQRQREAHQLELGPGTIFDKKELKAFCKATAKRRGYHRPSPSMGHGTALQKLSPLGNGVSACFSLDSGGVSTTYWETTAADFALIASSGESFYVDSVFLRMPGFVLYNSARPSNRELENVRRNPPVDPATITSVSQLRATYARHPRTPEQISDELKLCVVARFAFADLLLEHLHFVPDDTVE